MLAGRDSQIKFLLEFETSIIIKLLSFEILRINRKILSKNPSRIKI